MSIADKADLKQLRIFLLLMRERNISYVAQQVGLTQQAISEQLRKLRLLFGDPLFVRKSNGVVPTPAALHLEPRVQEILNQIERLLTPENFDPATLTGVYSICATDYAQRVVLPPLLTQLRNRAPLLNIIVRDFEIDELPQLMSRGDINLAITFPAFIPPNYPYLKLFTETRACVTSKKSKYKNHNLSISEIAALPQLVISPARPNLRGSIDTWFEAQGLKRNIVMSVTSFLTAADCIANTDVIAFLPSRLLPDKKLVEIPIEKKLPTFDIIAAWHPRSEHDRLHQFIMDLLKSQYYNDGN